MHVRLWLLLCMITMMIHKIKCENYKEICIEEASRNAKKKAVNIYERTFNKKYKLTFSPPRHCKETHCEMEQAFEITSNIITSYSVHYLAEVIKIRMSLKN